MNQKLIAAGALAAALLASASAQATTFTSILSGANERPVPVVSFASGTGSLFLADDQNSFSIQIDFTGLSANAAAAHIHCCSGPNANAGVAIGFAPPAATAGSILGSFDLTLASTYTSGFLNGAGGGTVSGARGAFLAGLASGNAYFNIHDSVYPGGEIRGQVTAVPEPGTYALMVMGLGMVGLWARRRETR